jgi:hypothetical protein
MMDTRGLEDLTEEQRRYVERIDAGEDAPEGERVEVRVRRPLEKVIPIRMSDDQWKVLTREAEELGVRPTTLMRMWVLERLREAERGHRGAARRGAVDAYPAELLAVAHEVRATDRPDAGTLSLAEVLEHADAESLARRLATYMAMNVEALLVNSGATERVSNDLSHAVRAGAIDLVKRVFDEELRASGGLTPPPSTLRRDV